MSAVSTQQVRNVALVGHTASGKSYLTQALLARAGVKQAQSEIPTDFTDEEKAHGHSLYNGISYCEHLGRRIHLIDTPGAADFLGQAITALPAVETVLVVVDAVAGVQPIARRMMQMASDRGICRMIAINRIDHEHAQPAQVLADIQEAFGKECLPINLPAADNADVVDCFFEPAGESSLGSVEEAHTALVDQIVEVDEQLMALYLEQGEELAPEQLHDPFEKALREGHLVPVCFTAGRPDQGEPLGIDQLLRILAELAPHPGEGNPQPFLREDDGAAELHPEPDPDKHVLAHVFNVRIDPFMGKVCALRIHQGTIRRDSQLFIGDPHTGESKKPTRVGHLYKLQGRELEEVESAVAGEIAALAKVEQIHHDAVLHDSHDEDRVRLKPVDLPQPMHGLAITPSKRGDEQKLADALGKLTEEDPTFRVTTDASTRQTVVSGLGELHVRVMLEKLDQRYHVQVQTEMPRIAYRETITGQAEGHHRHKKQTGGAGQFGEVYLRVEPLERGEGFEFANEIFGGAIPNQFVPAIEKGVREAMAEGAVAGYPIQDVKVTVYDGKHHPVDSKEVAFVAAGKRAFLDAVAKANPVLLEPMVELDVTVPEGSMGDVTGDLSGKRGRVLGTDMIGGGQASIRALVPLAELKHYQSQLKSMTGGQGSYTMSLSHYDPAPSQVQQELATAVS